MRPIELDRIDGIHRRIRLPANRGIRHGIPTVTLERKVLRLVLLIGVPRTPNQPTPDSGSELLTGSRLVLRHFRRRTRHPRGTR